MTSKFIEVVHELVASEALRCPNPQCGAVNTVGPGGTHITIKDGIALCLECLEDWRVDVDVA